MPRALYAVKQVITAGSDFDGEDPTTTPVDSNGLRVYPTDTQGGHFDFDTIRDLEQPISIEEILIKFGVQTSWDIDVKMHADDVVASAARTLEFKDNTPSKDTIEASSGSFIDDCYCAGMNITVTGTTLNNGTYKIASVTDLVITLEVSETLSDEGPLSSSATLQGFKYANVISGTNEDSYLWNDRPLIILPKQHLRITSSGASSAMFAWVIFAPTMVGEV